MKYSGFRHDVKCHVLTFSTSGQRQVTTCCTSAATSWKKCHVSDCCRQAGDVCCLRSLLSSKCRQQFKCLSWKIFCTQQFNLPQAIIYLSLDQLNAQIVIWRSIKLSFKRQQSRANMQSTRVNLLYWSTNNPWSPDRKWFGSKIRNGMDCWMLWL